MKKTALIFVFFMLLIIQAEQRQCFPQSPCSMCENSPTSCSSCIEKYYLLGDECIACTAPCVGCLNSKQCYDCDLDNSGYYLSGDQCVPCIYPCKTCYAPNYCLSCGWDAEKRNNDRFCKCQAVYYEHSQQCITCAHPCIACSSPTFCLNCNNAFTALYLRNGQCIPCEYPCITCQTKTICLSCGFDIQRRIVWSTLSPNCYCKPGWWDDGQECRECILPCIECTSPTKCLNCDNYNTGLWLKGDICVRCYYPCVMCMSPTHCLTCGWDFEQRNQNKSCSCKQGFFECGTVCKPCIEPCTACTSESNCIDCGNAVSGTFYFEDNCRTCEYPCLTCTTLTSCLSCGYGPATRNANTLCNCKIGYYESGYECVPCIAPCIKCTSPTFCQDCNHANSGLYLNDKGKCISCPYPCVKCTSPTNCLTCGWDLENRVTTHPQCICKPGYFEADIRCLTCTPPCKQCAESSILCLTCIVGTYLENGECKFCLYPCVTCTTFDKCITCGWGAELRRQPIATSYYMYLGEMFFVYDNQTCPCLAGYYLHEKTCLPCVLPCVTCTSQDTCLTYNCQNSVSGRYHNGTQCVPCNYPCQTCSNATTCLTCGYGAEKRTLATNCQCIAGTYQSGQQCLPCVLPCVNCTSATVCTTYNCQSPTSGLYLSGSQCVPCVYPCLTCTTNTNCLSCGYDVENRNPPSTCTCKSGFYQSGQKCFKCVSPCITCTSQTTCQTLISQTFEGLITGMYETSSKTIAFCAYPCLTCQTSPTNCYICGYGADLRVTPYSTTSCSYYSCTTTWYRHCNCKAGYYQKGQECLACIKPCINCSSQEVCTSNDLCDYTWSQLYLVGSSTCLKCEYPCKTCHLGAGAGYCQSCGYGAENRVTPYWVWSCNCWGQYQIWHRNCQCKDTFYEDGQECKKCVLPCLTCTSLTQCLTIFDCDQAISGLYRSGIQCVKCQYPCKTCSTATNCLSCGYDAQNRNAAPGTCSCKSGFYEHNQLCHPCVLPCLTCTSQTTCITIYDCDRATSGFYPFNNDCVACQYPCITCETATKCYKCGWDVINRRTPSDTKSCQCKDTFYNMGQQCFPCSLPCLTCTDEFTCLTTYACENTVSGMYRNSTQCSLCVFPCKTCSSSTYCLTCAGKLENRAGPNTCLCLSGYYPLGDECIKCVLPCISCTSATACSTTYTCDTATSGFYKSGQICYACVYPCINCTSSTSCLTCYYEVENRNNNTVCACINGYYEISNKCMKCTLPCLTCNQAGPPCLTYYVCRTGEYTASSNSTKKRCLPCQYPCKTCASNATDCRICGYDTARRYVYQEYLSYYNTYSFHSYVYDCRCKNGFYQHLALQRCLPCLFPCIMCSNSQYCYQIGDCNYTQTGLFPIGMDSNGRGGRCDPCQYPCATCYTSAKNCYSCGYGGASVRVNPYIYDSYWGYWDRTCKCKDGYFEKGQACEPCLAPCINCTALYTCITYTCNNAVSGLYWNTTEKICKFCQHPCKTCNSGPLDCTTCANDIVNRNAAPNCGCKSGFYEKDFFCYLCKLPCKTCESESKCLTYDCLSSSSGLYVFTPSPVFVYDPEGCDALSFEQQITVGCKFITPSCKLCEYPCNNCTSATSCLDCSFTPSTRVAANNCNCKSGFNMTKFVPTNTWHCLQQGCEFPCASCGSEPEDCLSCIDGYYLIGTSCQQCDSSCKLCSVDYNKCTDCGLQYYLENSMCLPCTYPCLTCKSKTLCYTCGYDTEFRNPVPSCTCKEDFFDTGQGCVKCIKPCKLCERNFLSRCTSCIDGYYLSGKKCEFCPVACDLCTDLFTCQKCSTGYYQVGLTCPQCVYPCQTCLNATFCYSCGYGPENRLPPPTCSCDNRDRNLYDNGSKACTTCGGGCAGCDPYNGSCLGCIIGYFHVPNGSTYTEFVPADQAAGEEGDWYDINGEQLYGNYKQFTNYGTCIQCMEGAVSCLSLTQVIQCQVGYYKEFSLCFKCVSPCLTCLNATFCYTCGYDPTEKRIQPPTCRCIETLSDHSDKCDTCTSPCRTCTGFGLDECLTCDNYFYISSIVGSTTKKECLPCHDSCFRCTGPASTQCIFDDLIKCRDGYFPSGTMCAACIYPCVTCSSLTYCYTCGWDIGNRHIEPSCICKDHLSDIGDQCIQCESPCRTCTTIYTDGCTGCVVGYWLNGTTCQNCAPECTHCKSSPNDCQHCAEKYFIDGNTCKSCVYPCINCYSLTQCYTCGFEPLKRNLPPACACKQEFSEYEQVCWTCVQPCKKCTADNTNSCTSCLNGYYLSGTTCLECGPNCLECNQAGPVCTLCKSGFYMDSDGITCLPCVPPCLTCFSSTFCYTCGYSPEKRVKPPTCFCQQIYVTIGNSCELCSSPCKTCTSVEPTDCLSCIDSYWLDGTQCKQCTSPCRECKNSSTECTLCIDGYYFKDTGDGNNCKPCEFPCINCYSVTQCLSCGFSPDKRIDPPSCQCKTGYAIVGQDCGVCTNPCLTCNSPSSTDCLSCAAGQYLLGSECKNCDPGCILCVTDSTNCSKCNLGYFQNGNTCTKCQYPCDECYSLTQCITCGYDFLKRIAPPSCACKRDLFSDDGTECVVCTPPCKWCTSTSSTECTKCIETYYLPVSSTQCQSCQLGCKFCVNTPTNCTECIDGYFMNTDGATCTKCLSPCATCVKTAKQCLTCGYGLSLRITPPTCECKDNYDDATSHCVVCQSPCKYCFSDSPTDCLGCVPTYVLNGSICEPCQLGCSICDLIQKDKCTSCIAGYFLRNTACLKCEYPCITCLESTFCYTCGFDLNNRRNPPPSCQCDYLYSDNGVRCVLCTSPCATCMSEELNDCLTCVVGYYLKVLGENVEFITVTKQVTVIGENEEEITTDVEEQQPVPSGKYCRNCDISCKSCTDPNICQSCNSGYYLDNNLCPKCLYPCATCLNATFCYTCGYDVVNKIQPPECKCKVQFSDSLNGDTGCITCVSPCATCRSVANNDCLSCVNDFYLDGSECLPCDIGCDICSALDNCTKCNDGYYLEGVLCIKCPWRCLTCLNATRCNSCQPGDNRSIIPHCSCKDGYYDVEDVGCTECPIPGRVCNSPTSYRTCADGYFWKDGEDGQEGTCLACISPCLTCKDEIFCYECTSALNRGNAPMCVCATEYYHDGINCTSCPSPIKVCEPGLVDGVEGVVALSCVPLYYVDNKKCHACTYPCVHCIVDKTCSVACGWDAEDRNPLPQCTCKTGYYDQKGANGDFVHDCVICPYPSIECLSETVFYSCVDTYYHEGYTNTCKQCIYPCLHCVSPTYCLKCGFEPEKRETPQTCNCLYGKYYQAQPEDDFCTQCSSPCKSCLGYLKCLTCVDGWTLEGFDCVPCQDPCVTCVGTICLTCGLEIEGVGTPSCQCLMETTDTGTYKECYLTTCPLLPCEPPCENCTSLTQCKTCIDNDFRHPPTDPDKSCLCIDGFSPDSLDKCVVDCPTGQYGVGDQCFDCEFPCKECDGLSTQCTECVAGYKLYGNFECRVQCQYPCNTCTGPWDCITCLGLYRDSTKNCICQDGYYEDSKKLCQICLNPCKTCNSVSDCTTCVEGVEGEYREGPEKDCVCLPTFTQFEGKCIKVCLPGFYAHFDQCLQCHPQCVTCSGQGAYCLQCTPGYYFLGVTCVLCPHNCLLCDNAFGCTSCDPNATGRSIELPACACQEGYFDRETKNCGICIVPCVTCHTTRTTCITCVEEGLNRKPPPDCGCINSYYAKDATCLECSYLCKRCVYIATECLECHGTGIGRTTNIPDCECQDGYYDVGVNDCSLCEYPCETCVNTATNCLTCQHAVENRWAPPNCNCADRSFTEIDEHCYDCLWKCATCVTTKENCLTCDEVNRIVPDCNCKDGYFGLDPELECHKCHKYCATCELTPENCLTCISGNNNEGNDIGANRIEAPNCDCLPTYFSNDKLVCTKCIHPCYECYTINTCKTCVNDGDVNRYDISNNCQCHDGYYTNGSTCASCLFFCATCNSGNNCQTCKTTEPQRIGDKCGCPAGYYSLDILEDVTCYECDFRCSHCDGEFEYNCQACNTGYVLLNTTCRLVCNTGCDTCQEFPTVDLGNCYSCKPGYYLLGNQCVKECPIGQSGDPDLHICVVCDTECKRCNPKIITECTACYGILVLDQKKCKVCTDVVGFYFNPTNSTECIEICGDGLKFNLPCDDGNNVDKDGCTFNCQVESGWVCKNGSPTKKDRCIDKNPITYNIFEVDADKTFLNLDKNAQYYFNIEFSKPFNLPEGKTLADYVVIKVQGHPNDPFTVKSIQNPYDPTKYTLQIDFETTVRDRQIQISFENTQDFLSLDGEVNLAQQEVEIVRVNNFFYYSNEQRQQVETMNFWVNALIAFLIIFIIPFWILNKFHVISVALDNMQLVFLLGFINYRQPLNGSEFFIQVQAFQHYYLPNPFQQMEKDAESMSNLPEQFQYKKFDPLFLNNVGQIIGMMLGVAFIYLFAKIVSRFQFSKTNLTLFYFQQLMYLAVKCFEWRAWNDFWSMTMILFSMFAFLNYQGFAMSGSFVFSLFYGTLALASPFMMIYLIKKSKKDTKNPYFREFWSYLNLQHSVSIYFLPVFYTRKLLYALIILWLSFDMILQLCCFIVLAFIFIMFLVLFKFKGPFKRRRDNIRICITELLTLIGLLLTFKMQRDDSEDEEARFNQSWIIIWCFVISLIVHDSFIVLEIITGLKETYRNKGKKFRIQSWGKDIFAGVSIGDNMLTSRELKAKNVDNLTQSDKSEAYEDFQFSPVKKRKRLFQSQITFNLPLNENGEKGMEMKENDLQSNRNKFSSNAHLMQIQTENDQEKSPTITPYKSEKNSNSNEDEKDESVQLNSKQQDAKSLFNKQDRTHKKSRDSFSLQSSSNKGQELDQMQPAQQDPDIMQIDLKEQENNKQVLQNLEEEQEIVSPSIKSPKKLRKAQTIKQNLDVRTDLALLAKSLKSPKKKKMRKANTSKLDDLKNIYGVPITKEGLQQEVTNEENLNENQDNFNIQNNSNNKSNNNNDIFISDFNNSEDIHREVIQEEEPQDYDIQSEQQQDQGLIDFNDQQDENEENQDQESL